MSGAIVAAAIKLDRADQRTPVGTRVLVVRDNGDVLLTRTRSDAWTLGHGQVVVSVHGISGGYAIERVHVVPPTLDTPTPVAP